MFFRSSRNRLSLFTRWQSSNRLALVARGVLTLWMTPVLMAALATLTLSMTSKPAQAQAAPKTVVVLDLSADAGVDPLLGRKAADAFAVDLAASREYIVIPRERVLQTVQNTAGLTPPFDEATQSRLGRELNASSIFSGRVISTEVTERQSARVTIEVRELDVATADYVNGVVVSEVSGGQLGAIDNDILTDQAINKAGAVAVRALRQSQPLVGTVLNTFDEGAVINLGSRNGLTSGQRFSVLRVAPNVATGRNEYVKVAEIRVTRVDIDQANVVTVSGNTGVRTGDRVRRIFDPQTIAYPVSVTGSSSPITVGAQRAGKSTSRKAGGAALGLLALAGLVALAGFGGGSSGTQVGSSPPTNVVARPVARNDGSRAIDVTFSRGLPGILGSEGVIGYLIYRGTTPNFAASNEALHDFVERNQTTYTDERFLPVRRNLTLFTTDNADQVTSPNDFGGSSVNDNFCFEGPDFPDPANVGNDRRDLSFCIDPPQPGVQYFYKVVRVTAAKVQLTADDGTTTSEARLRFSDPSSASGGATVLEPPVVLPNDTGVYDLDNFQVTIDATALVGNILPDGPDDDDLAETIVGLIYAYAAVDRFIVQVSVNPNFPADNTFSQNLPNPGQAGLVGGNFIFTLGNIRVPSYELGESLFLRVGVTNTRDAPGAVIYGQPVEIQPGALLGDGLSVGTRLLLPSGGNRRANGIGLPGSPNGSTTLGGTGRRLPGRIGR